MAEDTSIEPASASRDALFRTFLFADLRGYTQYTQEHGDDGASALAARFAALVRDTLVGLEGELLELRGDEALCVFSSPRQALRAAIELQRRLRTPNANGEVFPLGVGMGLDAGEAVPTEGGYRGRALNVAARLCAAATGGEVLASEGLAHLAQPLEGVRFGSSRLMRVKGVNEPVRVVPVMPQEPLPPAPRPPRRPGRGRRRVLLLGVLAVVVLVGAVVAVVVGSGGASARSVPVRANTVAIIDPRSGAVVRVIGVGVAPIAEARGFGAVWVANEKDDSVTRIDLKTHRTLTVPVNGSPTAIAAGVGAVWAYDTTTGRIFQLDPSGNVVAHYRLTACCGSASAGIAAAFGRVWVTDGLAGVFTLDTKTGRFTQIPGTWPSQGVVAGNGYVYTAGNSDIEQFNPTTPPIPQNHAPLGSAVHSGYRMGLTARGGQVWAVLPYGSYIMRLDPTLSLPVRAPSPQPPGDYALTTGAGALWVTNIITDSVYQMTPGQLTLIRTIRLPSVIPTGAVFADGELWITLTNPQDAPPLLGG